MQQRLPGFGKAHQVDAGPINWSFTLSEPKVTHTRGGRPPGKDALPLLRLIAELCDVAYRSIELARHFILSPRPNNLLGPVSRRLDFSGR